MKATEDILGMLHGQLAQAMVEKLKSGEFTSGDMNAIRQFLKDNSISCDPAMNEDMQDIIAHLPVSGDELDGMVLGEQDMYGTQ